MARRSNVVPIRKAPEKPKPVLKIRMRGRISKAGNAYWAIYVSSYHPFRNSYNNPWGWTPEQCWHNFIYNYKPNDYQPQMKPSCLSTRAPA